MDRLSEYVDDELMATERQVLEAHLVGCAACRTALEELRAVAARARSLDDRPPSDDLWPGIAARIGAASGSAPRSIEAAPSRRRGLLARAFTLSVPQLAAAAVALIVLSGAVVAGWIGSRTPTAVPLVTAVPGRPPGTEVLPASHPGGAPYDSAVAELQRALDLGPNRLDTATVRVIKQNLAIIDHAIAQARQALADDPESVYLSNHLGATMRRKVELLRRATALMSVRS
ncbi:MAG: zf-HC2 domain-containing protein [Gemmatimonadetes bacterium]|nr:zf-HC2 domain-containing protein [Gemmatimonadota bacterium]